MNAILCSFPDISWGNIKPQTANMIQLPLILVLIIIWKVKEEGGGNLRCLHREGTVASPRYVDATAAWRPLCLYSCTYHVHFFSSAYSTLRTCANTVWKKRGNLMVIVMNVDLADQKSRRRKKKGNARESWEEQRRVCLDARVSLGFMRRNDLGGETWLFFPLLLFPRTQGSRLLQEGRALPRHASLEGFLQATSRLFGCHWDCLKRICFCTVLQGAPHQEKSRSPLSTWHCCYAFVNIKAKRLGQCV